MTTYILDCDIQPEVLGSDHCPVQAVFNFKILPPDKPPEWCTKNFKEFSGKQVKVSDFFVKADKSDPIGVKRKLLNTSETSKKSKITNFFVARSNTKIASSTSVQPDAALENRENEGYRYPEKKINNAASKNAWGELFKPPPPAPLCLKHKEEALKRKVSKNGPNKGREFWVCRRGEGRADDPEARCDFFKWVKQ